MILESAFERKVQSRLGDQAIKTLRLLSLMTHVGLKGTARKEIEAICSQFGDGQPVNTVLNEVEHLVRAGVLRTAGSYVEVVPPLFANRLALSACARQICRALYTSHCSWSTRTIKAIASASTSERRRN